MNCITQVQKIPLETLHPLTNTGRLAVWLISNNVWKQRKYLKASQNSSQMQEEHVHRLVANLPGISGLAGMHKGKSILFDVL